MKIALDVKINQAYHLTERFELELLGDARENRGIVCFLDQASISPQRGITKPRFHTPIQLVVSPMAKERPFAHDTGTITGKSIAINCRRSSYRAGLRNLVALYLLSE